MTMNDDATFLSTLQYIETNRETSDKEMEQYIHNMCQMTAMNQERITHLNSHRNGETICILLEILNQELNKGNKSNKRMISECITILGRILSSSQNEAFSNMFIDEDGIETLYNQILLSSKYKKNELIVLAVVDFLSNVNHNHHIGHQQIVLNNEDYQFIFQIASILKKQSLNYNFGEIMNRFAILLCDLYHQKQNESMQNRTEDDEDEDDEDDDENNIKSILNSLIFTGFVTTISKRTAMIKADCVADIDAMTDIIMVLMHCNPKKTCSKFINASIPKRILEFIAANKSDKDLLHKLFECLTIFHKISAQNTLNQLEENQYMEVISSIDGEHHKIAQPLIHAIHPESISPSNRSIEDEKTFESTNYVMNNMEVESKEFELEHIDENLENMMAMVDISEQENASTMNPDVETETESQTISPKTNDTPAHPPPANTTQHRATSDGSSMNDLPPIPRKPLPSANTHTHMREDGGSEMHLVLDAIHDIQDTIMSLQQTMDKKAPQMVKKYVAEHHAPRYSGIEQQRYIDAETARIMAERQEEEKDMDLTQIREDDEEVSDENRLNHKKNKEAIVYDSDSGARIWAKFRKYYHKYIENSKSERAVQSLRNVLEKLREFGHRQQKQCIDSLLHCKSRNTVICNFLFCLQICDDIIRENVVECLDSLYDLADEDFISFTHNNNVIEYLCKALMVRHDQLAMKDTKNALLSLTSTGSARVDMKILQVLAVNFSGKELLYHRVFNKIKDCIMSPYQHIDFIVYAMQVIKTVIDDTGNVNVAKKWINRECVGDMNMDHTVQFAVFIMQTYGDSEAAVLSRGILVGLRVDVNQALIEYGMDDDNDVVRGLTAGQKAESGHSKQISNFYKHLERDQMRKHSLQYQKLKDWMGYLQRECNNSHLNNGVLSDNEEIVDTLRAVKRFMMVHDKEDMWQCFYSLNSINILCDVIAVVLMGNSGLWNKLLFVILDVIVLYANHEDLPTAKRDLNADQYVIKCMVDILLRYLSIMMERSDVMSKACFILDAMTHEDRLKHNPQCIAVAMEYGGIDCMLNVICHYTFSDAVHGDKSLMVCGLNFLNHLCANNDKNKKLMVMNHAGIAQILNMLRPSMVDESDEDDVDFSVICAVLRLLLSLTAISHSASNNRNELEASETVTCNLILVLINQMSILNILYNAIELLQKDKNTLYLLLELLLNLCSNCNKLSIEVEAWVVRIVLEFSNKYQKSQIIHCFMIRIVTAIVEHNPATNVQIFLKQNGASLTYIFETMKLCQYKEEVVLLVFTFMNLICDISEDLKKYFVTSANIFKFIVHVMKNWYVNDKESTASRIIIIQQCCQMIVDLCLSDECSAVANDSHVTSSLIKLVIAHQSGNNGKENAKQMEDSTQRLKQNIYLIRIPMFIEVLRTLGALTKQREDIALKVAKHAIKTMIKAVHMHITSDPNDKMNSYHRIKTQSNPQHKLLLTVFMEYITVILSVVSPYIIKYDMASILIPPLLKYSNSKDEDFAMCSKLINFMTLLLSTNSKAYAMLESDAQVANRSKTSVLINNMLSAQKNSYRSYQPLMDSCHGYQKELRKCVHKINQAQQSGSPIPILQSTTGPMNPDLSRGGAGVSVPVYAAHNGHTNYAKNFYPNFNGYHHHQPHHSQPHSMIPPAPMRPHSVMIGATNPPQPHNPHHKQYHTMESPIPTIYRHRPVFSHSQSQIGAPQQSPVAHIPPAPAHPPLQHTTSMNAIQQMKQPLQRQPRPQRGNLTPISVTSVGTSASHLSRFNPNPPPPSTPPPNLTNIPNPPPPPASPANPPNVIPNTYRMKSAQPRLNHSNQMSRPMSNPRKKHSLNIHQSKKKNAIPQQLPSSMVQLLTTGSVMTKYPSIHTHTPSHLQELNKMKSKPKIVRVSPDWQTIEFHNIPNQSGPKNAKPPKVLPIGNMKYVDSEHANRKRTIAKPSMRSKELFIYGLDKNGKEIVIKLVCQNVIDAKRWTRALDQIITHSK
eukprot:281008_1